MSSEFTRREALALGVSAAAMAATGASAQAPSSAIKVADVAAPVFEIEKGANLRMLRPVRFVQPDEDVFRANAARFTIDFRYTSGPLLAPKGNPIHALLL